MTYLLHQLALEFQRFARRRLERAVERCERHGEDMTEMRIYMAENPVEGL